MIDCLVTTKSTHGVPHKDFFDRGLLLTRKEQNLVFLVVKLKSSFQKFYCCHDLVNHIRIHVSQMTTVMFHLSNYNPVISLFMMRH